jgi:8-oxo-dGTP pyrophosphatase MutT (NUDIX family)
MRTLSSGVIYTDGTLILLGHATGTKHWDIPKGKVDPGENVKDAAIRELQEETGLSVNIEHLIDLGQFKYRKEKDLYIWKYVINPLPPIESIICSSKFITRFGYETVELDRFKYVQKAQVQELVAKSLWKVLESLL